MIEQIELTIDLCDQSGGGGGGAASPAISIVLSVFLMFLYLNRSTALAPISKQDLTKRLNDAYEHRKLFINTQGTCASNAYLFLGAQSVEQHNTKTHLGYREALVNGKVFTKWTKFFFRDIPEIADFSEIYKSSKDYANFASELTYYFLLFLESQLDAIDMGGQPFFTYMGFNSIHSNMEKHAVVLWYNPQDKHIILINPQDFMADGRIIYVSGDNWRNYFGFGNRIRHYSLQKYIEDNVDFFAGLGGIVLLMDFHVNVDPFAAGSKKAISKKHTRKAKIYKKPLQISKGGNNPRNTIRMPDGNTYEAKILDNGKKHLILKLSDNSLLYVVETDNGLSMIIQLPNNTSYSAIMLPNGIVAPILNNGIPCIVTPEQQLIPAVILQDYSLFPGTLLQNNNYIVPTLTGAEELTYNIVNSFSTKNILKVVHPNVLKLTYITTKNGYSQHTGHTTTFNIYNMTNPSNNKSQYIAIPHNISYISITTGTPTYYFTWTNQTLSFHQNKDMIDIVVYCMINVKHNSAFETVAFFDDQHDTKLTSVAPVIQQLNQMLSIVCDGQLEIGNIQNMTANTFFVYSDLDEIVMRNNILLCLNIRDECVSSVCIMYDKETRVASLESYTKSECQGKLYNKLLRAAAIILMSTLYPRALVFQSVAVNYFSAYQMIQYFGGIIESDDADANDDFLDFLGKTKPIANATMDDVKQYFDNIDPANLIVNIALNSDNINKARSVFDSIIHDIDRFTCSC